MKVGRIAVNAQCFLGNLPFQAVSLPESLAHWKFYLDTHMSIIETPGLSFTDWNLGNDCFGFYFWDTEGNDITTQALAQISDVHLRLYAGCRSACLVFHLTEGNHTDQAWVWFQACTIR